jgi:hypothetical protein
MPAPIKLTEKQIAFLARFAPRGWMAYPRDDADEQEAVELALRKRWLRRELSEVQFTARWHRAING